MGVCITKNTSGKQSFRQVESQALLNKNEYTTAADPTRGVEPEKCPLLPHEMGASITKGAVESGVFQDCFEHDSSQISLTTAHPPTIDHTLFVEPDIEEMPPKNFFRCVVCEKELLCRGIIRTMFSEASSTEVPYQLLHKWEKEGILSEISIQAFSSPAQCSSSIKELSKSLTSGTRKYLKYYDELSINLAKAYAIYVWVANNMSFDVKKWKATMNGQYFAEDSEDIELILEERKGTSSAFSMLYAALSKEAGLFVEIAYGNIRQWRSVTGEVFQPNQANFHSWNIVTIESIPFIVDPMLGSGYLSQSMGFIKKFTYHYFAVPPHYSILTHWPNKSSQQHLKCPISLQNLQSLIPVNMLTLGSGISPTCWSEVIDVPVSDSSFSSGPVASITIRLEENKDMNVTAQLLPASLSENLQDEDFRSLSFVKANSKNVFQVYAVLPRSGKFIFNIYLNNSPIHDNLHLSYVINSNVGEQTNVGYPYVFPIAARPFKFKLLYWNQGRKSYNCIHSGEKTFGIVFEADKSVSFNHYIVQGKVETNSSNSILHYNTMMVGGKKNIFQLLTTFPSNGWWTIHLSATKLRKDDDIVSGYTTLLNYYVHVENGFPKDTFPQILMPNSIFFDSNPITSPSSTPLDVKFASINSLDFMSYVTCNQAGSTPMEGYSTIEHVETVEDGKYMYYQLNAVFPKCDVWLVHVFSRQSNNDLYTATFKLKLEITEPIPNKFLLQSIDKVKKHCGISFSDSCIVTFYDGKPFTFSFTAPIAGIDFQHVLTFQEDRTSCIDFHHVLTFEDNAVDYRTHFIARDEEENAELSKYSLTVLFPKCGNWVIELYAMNTAMGDDEYSLVTRIKLNVSHPIPNLCYPKILPAFRRLGMKIKEADVLLQETCITGELKLAFQAPENTMFLCNLDNAEAKDSSQQAYVHKMPDSQEKILHVIFPELGYWNVSLFAKQMSADDSNEVEYTQVLQLSLNNTMSTTSQSFPQIFEGFYKFNINLAKEDIPLPTVLNVTIGLHLLLKFYSPEGVKFLHYASFTESDQEESTEESSTREHMMTTMVSNLDTGLHQVKIEVTKAGQWTVYIFAESLPSSASEWTSIMKYRFSAVS